MTQTMRIEFVETDGFQKNIKQLLKKYRTLKEDLEVVKRDAIFLYHIGRLGSDGIVRKIDNGSIFPIPGFCSEQVNVYKIKKFACKSIKGKGCKSGIRVIYAFHSSTSKVDFIEIYYKGEKENEDRDRIKNYLRNFERHAS